MKISIVVLLQAVCAVLTHFHVEKSGIIPIRRGDLGIQFYINIANDKQHSTFIRSQQRPNCCWQVGPSDEDCLSITLIGGNEVSISPLSTANLTFVFANKYPLDRLGACSFTLVNDQGHQLHHIVEFDTTDPLPPRSKLPKQMTVRGQCKSVDQDPDSFCTPVDCALKYNGHRNFYRHDIGQCEPAAYCITKLDEENLPTTAFDIVNNRCKSLVTADTKEDNEIIKQRGAKPVLKEESLHERLTNPEKMEIDCNHGVQEGSFCICEEGWKSTELVHRNGLPYRSWCSKRVKYPAKKYQWRPAYAAILSLLAILLLVLTVYLTWTLFIKNWKLKEESFIAMK